ncbi:hypothetical protein EfmAA290_07790 [Enterococcus faecium]|nr:hypothetical protein EfmAA290_07790 [Enterococcus faecium]
MPAQGCAICRFNGIIGCVLDHHSRDVPFIKKKSGKIKRMDFEDAKAAIRRIYEQMPENQRAGLNILERKLK